MARDTLNCYEFWGLQGSRFLLSLYWTVILVSSSLSMIRNALSMAEDRNPEYLPEGETTRRKKWANMKTSIKEIIFKQCVWVFASFALHGFRENICLLYGDLAQENYKICLNLQLTKCKKKKKNYQNVTLFISYQSYMYVRTSQMRAN